MDFGAVSDFGVFVGKELQICGGVVIVFGEDVFNAVIHCESTGMFGFIPVKVDAVKAGSGPVLIYLVMFS